MSEFEPRSRDELLKLLGRFSETTAEWERRELLAMSEEYQDVILRRLDVLDRFLVSRKPTTADADAAAEVLRTPRSNVYRMLKRYKQAGALIGLAPHARVKRPGPRAGEGYDFSDELTRLLRDNPEAKLGFFVKRIEEIAAATDVVRPPSRTTIQRRVAEFRSATAAPTRRSAAVRNPVFGRDLLIDGCLLGVPSSDAHFGTRLAISMVVDLDTRLVMGAGVSSADKPERALGGAVADTQIFWDAPLIGNLHTRSVPERIEWILPPRKEGFATGFAARARSRGIEGVTNVSADREHGGRLIDVLGAEYGEYQLVPFVLDPDSVEMPSRNADPIVTIARRLMRSIEEWNMELVRRHEKARLVLRGSTWDRRLQAWTRRERISDLDAQDLAVLLSGVIFSPSDAEYSVRRIWRGWEERSGRRDQM